jgi:hypothetical protein
MPSRVVREQARDLRDRERASEALDRRPLVDPVQLADIAMFPHGSPKSLPELCESCNHLHIRI